MIKDTNFTQHAAMVAVKARFEFCKETLDKLENSDIEDRKLFLSNHAYYTGELEALRPAVEYYDRLILRSGRG